MHVKNKKISEVYQNSNSEYKIPVRKHSIFILKLAMATKFELAIIMLVLTPKNVSNL